MIKKIPVMLVTKGNTDGSIKAGDHLYYSGDGALNCQEAGGWMDASELTPEIMDFQYEEDKEHIVLNIDGTYRMVSKKELEE